MHIAGILYINDVTINNYYNTSRILNYRKGHFVFVHGNIEEDEFRKTASFIAHFKILDAYLQFLPRARIVLIPNSRSGEDSVAGEVGSIKF